MAWGRISWRRSSSTPGRGIETGHAYRPALTAGETNSVVIPELYFGSVQEGMSNLKIGKALFTSFDGNRGPYSGADAGGFTFRMDYRGANLSNFLNTRFAP